MVKNAVSHKPGDIITLGGIEFGVLDVREPVCSDDPGSLFVVAVNTQGDDCRFGDTNDYTKSDLREAVDEWLEELGQNGVDLDLIEPREIDLTTLDGRANYGKLEVKAAPLTLDEARMYAKFIPESDDWSWLATGWGAPGMSGSRGAFIVGSGGGWGGGSCSYSHGIRPALVISSSLLTSEREPDLTDVPTDVLLGELRRRIGE
jgi:hypothetical protein